MALIDTIAANVQMLLGIVQYLVGGIFGLYLILVFLRWKEYRFIKKIMVEMNSELKKLNENLENKKPAKKK